jgi:hypothetical protein
LPRGNGDQRKPLKRHDYSSYHDRKKRPETAQNGIAWRACFFRINSKNSRGHSAATCACEAGKGRKIVV